MVRDLAKSMFRFTWAMGMLGVEQAASLVHPKDGIRRSADGLNAVSEAAEDQMGDTLRNFYKAGDHLQAGVLDAASKMVDGSSWRQPSQTMNAAWHSLDRAWSDMRSELRRKDDGRQGSGA